MRLAAAKLPIETRFVAVEEAQHAPAAGAAGGRQEA
jgi:ribosomal protein L16/L10AE